jgi:hypothetical protein
MNTLAVCKSFLGRVSAEERTEEISEEKPVKKSGVISHPAFHVQRL